MKSTKHAFGIAIVGCLLLSAACGSDGEEASVTPDIFAPAGEAMPRASEAQKQAFERGRQVALRRFTKEDGLGPTFNLVSCAGCHERPVTGGSAGHYRDFLLVNDTLSDGSVIATGKNGVQAQYRTDALEREASDPATTHSATRNPIPFFGSGLLAEVSDEEILRRADPDDADGDGIRGRPNYDRGFVGRFGRKAQTVSLEGFIRGPLFNHLGVTSDPLSNERKLELPVPSGTPSTSAQLLDRVEELWVSVAHAQVAAPDEPNMDDDGVPDPELSADELFDLVSFTMLLAPLTPDAEPSEEAVAGHSLFRDFGCASCHVEDLRGPGGLVPAYSDLLLHDMGPELDDGIVMGEARGRDFRTQPLWGVGATGPYLHDGRADTLVDAILLHGGEGSAARDAFAEASAAQQRALVAFLESLGGSDVYSEGLIAPGTPMAEVGTPGGPRRNLNAKQRARFLRGREVFDRDLGGSLGLGPAFNGDSCRACHFDPVPGGAGPGDVDVTRQAVGDGSTSLEPDEGTMLHKHSLTSLRPEADPEADVFERRQTPSLLGLGLVDRIDDATILALADPEDEDGDGISGRPHVLSDGRLGRFGWKANLPSVLDFVHDAMSTEMGISLPAGQSRFGFAEDDDDVKDPELDQDALDDLVFFLQELGPPPAPEANASSRAATTQLRTLGCADCHVPELPTRDDESVALYSDLLLHDVGSEDYVGIPDGDALPRELRTPPLWGLGATAPYMHDGSASTVEQAIAAHASEALASRRAYEALDAEARARLLAFLESL